MQLKKKAFVRSEAFIKNLFNKKEFMFILRVDLLKSNSYFNRKENLIESKEIYQGIFDADKEPVGLDYFSAKPPVSQLNDHANQAGIAFNEYIKSKELIYNIEVI